jgi:hypothetical protein
LGIAEADGKKSSAILTLKPHVDKPLWKILLAAAAFLPPWDIEQKYGTMDPTLTAATWVQILSLFGRRNNTNNRSKGGFRRKVLDGHMKCPEMPRFI